MRKTHGSKRFQLSFEGLDQRIAPSGGVSSPPASPPADTGSGSDGGSTNIGTPLPPGYGGGPSPVKA